MNEFSNLYNKVIERYATIAYLWSDPNSSLEKSIKDNEISSHLDSTKIVKKGKEVKEAFEKDYRSLGEQKEDCFKKMSTLVNKIGIMPIESMKDRYSVEKYNKALINIPYIYGSEQRYPRTPEAKEASSDMSYGNDMPEKRATEVVPSDVRSLMYQYNELANKYIEICINALKLKVVIENIEEKVNYSINVDLAARLGL